MANVPDAPKRPRRYPEKVPRFFGGEFNTDAEYRWDHAMRALAKVAGARPDSALEFVAYELEEALGAQVQEAADFGTFIGCLDDPQISTSADDWTDEHYEAITGRKRPVES